MWLMQPQKFVLDRINFDKLQKENKGKKWDDMSEEYHSALIGKIPMLFLSIWMISGLFTFNWVAFLIILVFNFLIITPIGKALKFSKGYTILHWSNSLIGLIWGVFIIINSYHLKIDLLNYLANAF